jgi:Tfp pilus assembly protein PilO
MRLNKLQQTVAGLILILVTYLLCQFVVFKSEQNNIVTIETNIVKLRQDIHVARAIQTTAAQLQSEMVHLKNQLERLKKILPVTVNKPKFLADIKRYANENGIEILELTNNKPVPDDVIVEHPFSFKTRGNYHDYGYFFSQLTNYQRIVNVKGLRLFRANDPKEYAVDSFFLVSVYTYNEPTEAELKKQIEEKKQARLNKGKKKRRGRR